MKKTLKGMPAQPWCPKITSIRARNKRIE